MAFEASTSGPSNTNLSERGEVPHEDGADCPVNPSLDLAHHEVVVTDKVEQFRVVLKGKGLRQVNQYLLDNLVGRGQHGDVWLAMDTRHDYMQVAVKIMKRKNPKVDRMSAFRKKNSNIPRSRHTPLVDQLGSTEHKIRKEIAIMKKVNHPHVVRLLEVLDDDLKEQIFMVMEYLGGGEIKWRTDHDEPVLRVSQTRRICRDVILGLDYLHRQGIIHRDIKPANLLWSADRRTVKITDFGVSHFSYAQRLAAAGKGELPADSEDPILMDDSDLSKTAGTPMFLAPEIVWEPADITPSSSKSRLGKGVEKERERPPITKAIDVWAFGITLYGLLFGHLPFAGSTEFEIYNIIRKQDWGVDLTMGVDDIPVGGRYQRAPPKGKETEGYHVVHLLRGLLEKDARNRMTLDDIKKHPWILRDLPNPRQWLRDTQNDGESTGEPSIDETNSAMSVVRFRWQRAANGVSSGLSRLLRGVRTQRSFRQSRTGRDDDDALDRVGVRSAPSSSISRHKTTIGVMREHRDKGKGHQNPRPRTSHNKSTTDVHLRGSTAMARRGSLPSAGKKLDMTLHVPQRPYRIGSAQSVGSSPPESSAQSPDGRPRSRASFPWLWPLFHPGADSKQAEPGVSSSLPNRSAIRELLARRSEDALHAHHHHHFRQSSRQSSASGVTLAARAASWGEIAAYSRPDDGRSVYSDNHYATLDQDTLLLGAGGIARSPVSSIPGSGVMSTVSSTTSLGPPAISAAHAILHRSDLVPSGEVPSMSNPATQDPNRPLRTHSTSPLVQTAFNPPSRRSSIASYDTFEDDDDSYEDLSTRIDHIDLSDEVELQPSTSQRYHAEDEESDEDDEETFPLEVRTRRPSVTLEASSVRNNERSIIYI